MSEVLFGFGIGLIVGTIMGLFIRAYDGYKAGFYAMKKIGMQHLAEIQAAYEAQSADMEKLKKAAKQIADKAEENRQKYETNTNIFLEYMVGNKQK